jgi:cell division protein FtsZ
VNEAAEIIGSASDADANIIFGAVIDEAMGDQVRVTVIATGFDRGSRARPAAAFATGTPDRSKQLDEADAGDFEVPREALEIPSFLRDQ